MNTTSRIVMVLLVGLVIIVSTIYVRVQRKKIYAQMIAIEELREELKFQRKEAEKQKELMEICRMEAERSRMECEQQMLKMKM